MPTYIRPRRAIIETGGGGSSALLALLAAAVCMLAAAVAAWVLAHAVLLAVVLAVFVAALGGFCAWCRWVADPRRLAEVRATESLPQPAVPTAVQQAIRGQRPITTGRPAIAPAQHLHLHFHGADAAEAAAIISRREIQP